MSLTFYVKALLSIALPVYTLWSIFRDKFFKSALDNIPGPPSESFFTGVLDSFFNNHGWDYHKKLAETYGGVMKIKAAFGENELYVFDPKALHHIFVKDQDIYEETPQWIQGNGVVYGPGLLATLGEQHRKQRKMLNPVFSTAHMRDMMPIFYDVTSKLREAMLARVTDAPKEIDILSWMSRTALELIGQSGMGYSFDPLTADTAPHPYSQAAKNLELAWGKLRLSTAYLLPPLSKIGSAKFRRFVVNMIPWKDVHDVRDIVDVLTDTSIKIFDIKTKALTEGDEALATQIGRGKDIMSILMKANMSASKEDSLTQDELLGQMSSLLYAATDTTSSALSRILHLLAMHQDMQDKLRQEIKDAKAQEGGNLPYDQLVALPYLDALCRESLRLHAPVPLVRRIARQDIVLPLSNPIKGVDGRAISEVFVPTDTKLTIGIMASNRNPELWGPDAHEFKPERWLNPLPDTLTAAHLPGIYSHLMTFIGGSRACM
ncbi:cytochrome P450 [Pholiota molesta]|nr:cytochrome P450 [Pholiota molesta]